MEDNKNLENENVENQEAMGEENVQEEVKESKKDRKKNEKRDDKDAKVQEMGEKLAEMNDKYMRTVAEYENYRKRTMQEKAELIMNGGKDVIKAMLPVIDDMERALSSFKDDDPMKEGVQLVYNKLLSSLGQKGLKPMEAKGEKFDENLHEAVTQIPAPTEELKGGVVDVVEKGYFLNDKVLRFAKVVVGC